MRRNLVVVRAGDQSLHPHWLTGNEKRNWDLHLSYYGSKADPFPDRPADVSLSFERGLKGEGIMRCLETLGDRLNHYDYVWLPDDDLMCSQATLNRFFDLANAYKLDLCQPALGPGSFVSHGITRQRPGYRLRYTTFVEIMCPCFSRHALGLCQPYLDATVSSWGLDLLFPKLLGYPARKIAIIDETPVIHTRPVGGGDNMPKVRSRGSNPMQEAIALLHTHGFALRGNNPYRNRLETLGGIRRDGSPMPLSRLRRHLWRGARTANAWLRTGVATFRSLRRPSQPS